MNIGKVIEIGERVIEVPKILPAAPRKPARPQPAKREKEKA